MTSISSLVFCGTPAFAVPTLEKLVEAGFSISLVVTQPDRPRGRGLELVASPVKQSALQLALPIAQPERIKNNEDFRAQLTALQPGAIIVVGYGRIVPQWMLDLPPLGNINLHASLLPKYRGAAPIQWAIARDEIVTGVTTMKIDDGLDTGDILLQQELPIAPQDTAETLSPKLARIGADLTVETLRRIEAGDIHPRAQDHAQATLAPILKKEDGLIDFSRPAAEILNRLRGFQPWPGAYTKFRGKSLQVRKAAVGKKEVTREEVSRTEFARPEVSRPEASRPETPGELIVERDRMLVACAERTTLELLELQLEGKKLSTAADFLRGYRIQTGEKLGS
jgi:methionyl-tRNA formyltransferase